MTLIICLFSDEFNTEEILDTYSPFFLDDDAYGTYGLVSSSWVKVHCLF